jgi:hypothetical protein
MGCIGLFYPNFVVFIVFGPKGILVFLVFWFGPINRTLRVGAPYHFFNFHMHFVDLD